MHPELVLLADLLATIVEDISQDIRSISLSVKEVNHSVLKMVKKKPSTSVSAPDIVDVSNKEILMEKDLERHPGFPYVLERLVVAVESLPHEVRNISLSLKDINENISCLSRQEQFMTQDVPSWINENGSEEENPAGRADQSLIRKERHYVSGMESPSASSLDETDFLRENLHEETFSSQDSILEGKGEGSFSSNQEDTEKPACANASVHLSPDCTKSSHATDATELDTQNANIGKIHQILKEHESPSTSMVSTCVPEREGSGNALRSFDDTTIRGDHVSSSVTASLQLLGECSASETSEVVCGFSAPKSTHLEEKSGMSEKRDKKSFECPTCNKTFDQRDNLCSHLPRHCRKALFKCSVCRKAFPLKRHLNAHMEMHSSESIPKFSARDKSTFRKCISVQEKQHLCEHCGKGFKDKKTLLFHKHSHSGEKPHTCNLCNKSFSLRRNLVCHMRRHSGEKRYTCKECEKAFVELTALIRHKRSHTGERPYKCSMCQRAFTTNHCLKRHKLVHTGDRVFSCTECKSFFKQKSHLSTHTLLVHKHQKLRVSVSPSSFLCDHCGKVFNAKPNLLNHLRTHTGEKPYKCNLCDRSFAQSSHLVSHRRVHTGEKPFKCQECGKDFKSISTLSYHKQATHSSDRPYKCDVCESAFVNKAGLSRHALKHTNERPYACSECESRFKQKPHLITHQRLIHKVTHPSS